MKKIYLAHALSNAPQEFRDRLAHLAESVKKIPQVEVLHFAWAKGDEFNKTINVFDYDMDCVKRADLVVAILEHPSFGVGMEIMYRCELGTPLLICIPKGKSVSKIITDCMISAKKRNPAMIQGQIEYTSEQDILDHLSRSIQV